MSETAAEAKAPSLPFSPMRIWVIASNTITEVTRQKVFYVFVLFALVLIGASNFFAQFSFNAQLKSIEDTCLGAISIFTSLIAFVGTALLLPAEIENRTIYTILTKPVYRIEFLLGKFVGMAVILLFVTLVMSLLFGGVLFFKERELIESALSGMPPGAAVSEQVQPVVDAIHAQVRNPNLIKAVFLLYIKAALLAAITILVSTFATSGLFSIIIMFMVYICGHLQAIADQVWKQQPSVLGRFGLGFIKFFIPDLQSMTVVDDVIVGKSVTAAYLWGTTGYALVFMAVALFLASLVFEEKEL